MNPKILLGLALVWGGGPLGCSTMVSNVSSNPSNHPSGLPVLYRNAQYDFTFSLPTNWRGYSVLIQQWEGNTYLPDGDKIAVVERGPVVVLRHPQWKSDDRHQDIPILVFTRRQWDAEHHGKFGISAGGISEEIAHNPNYVFAVSSRFAADENVKGWEETFDIVERNREVNGPHLYPE
jgi:hypothetical protein